MTTPLEGVRVVEFGHYIAAPAATQLLADLGADVIKVEPPSGDQARGIGAYGEGIVLAYNRGKRSVVLDLKRPGDRSIAADLIARNPDPSEDEVREALAGNLCRCTGYHNIVKAVRAAAAEMARSNGTGSQSREEAPAWAHQA